MMLKFKNQVWKMILFHSKNLFAIIFILVLFINAGAQHPEPRFERISLNEGLSQSIVNVIYKDKEGFMWFGTQSGLNKYDGYKFKIYKYNPIDSNSISNNNILSIYEDTAGFLWIGTSDGGLNKFDRAFEKFTRYLPNPDDSTSISHVTVPFIFEDKQQRLWVLTAAGGIDMLNRRTGEFTHFRHNVNNKFSLSNNFIRDGEQDKAGRIWIGTLNGLNLLNEHRLVKYDTASGDSMINTNCFIRFYHDPHNENSLSYNEITSIYEAPSEPGVLWIGTGDSQNQSDKGGLNRYDIEKDQFTRYFHDLKNPKTISDNFVFPILEDKSGTLWIGTLRGLNKFDRQTETFSSFFPDPDDKSNLSNAIVSITEDITGALWITTAGIDGIYRFDKWTSSFHHFQHNPNDPYSLSHNQVLSVYEDIMGVLWIGTMTGGINKLDHYSEKFIAYKPVAGDKNSLSGSIIRAFCIDEIGHLWVGAAGGGLNEFDNERRLIHHYRYPSENKSGLNSDNIFSLFRDSEGTLWIGTINGGLNKFNRNRKTFKHYTHDPKNSLSISGNSVRVIFEDHARNMWIGTDYSGLNLFDRKKELFRHFIHNEDDQGSLGHNSVRAIAQSSDSTLWIGTFGGGINAIKFSAQNNKLHTEIQGKPKPYFHQYQADPRNPNSLSSNLIQSIYIDKNDILWIGTFGGGLNKFNPATEKFEHFTEQNSDLPDNVIYAILGDDQGNIWMSSNKGISKFYPQTCEFENFDVDDGLQSKEFNGQACFKSPTGEMFFGGINGFNVFHPDSIYNNPHVPEIVITDFKLFGVSMPIGGNSPLKKDISGTDEIVLSHWQKDISFEFVALHYNRPNENRYSYILVNYDDDWKYVKNQRTATYTSLEPGEYFFRVRGSNNDGNWNKKGRTIRVVIKPPWWQTVWAYISYSIFGIVIFGFVHYFQKSIVIRRERAKTKLVEAELRAQAAEAQARAIQAENERKTHELEKARRLQLSMLPKDLPNVPNLDIAVQMKTATEVGGDYYDFHLDTNGDLTVVIGDATGHGLNAGTMVSVIKSLFVANISQTDFNTFFEKCTKTIKQLQLGNLYMALALVKIQNHEMIASAAGMPPIYIYRKRTRTVQEIIIKGMPLGAFDEFEYYTEHINLEIGDVILLMSDGLPELFNEKKEMFDFHRVKENFEKVAEHSPREIINHFMDTAEKWRKNAQQQDDFTFVVMKVKEI